MKFYSFSIVLILILVLTGSISLINANFYFIKKIPSAILDIFQNKESQKGLRPANKHLMISPQFGIYSTVWSARSKRMNDLIRVAENSEINVIVIDVKDSGVYLDDYVKDLVKKLHEKNIYAIARLVVFQDSSQTKVHPSWYFKKEDGTLWRDNRGWYWMDPSNREAWEYNLMAAKKAIDAGFDELNFDYIRYPAFAKDDNVDLSSLASAGKPAQLIGKNEIINEFSAFLNSELKKYDPEIVLSIDLFAYNMLKRDDLGIGQKFTELYDYFDYVSPMIYPSHYLPGNFGFENPAEYPYEVVLGTIEKGKTQLWEKSAAEVGTTTPSVVNPIFEKRLKKLRPWLQDFNIGAIYDGEMIRKEKQAVYDAGLTSGWLLWNPRNVYTESALDK